MAHADGRLDPTALISHRFPLDQAEAAYAESEKSVVTGLVALRKSEERFRDLAELGSDGSWEQDEKFRFVSVSKTVPPMGCAPSEMVMMA